VIDMTGNRSQLFARSILSTARDLRPGDGFHQGVALRATPHRVSVYPYLFRLVCTNGAIRAHALEGRQIIVGDRVDAFLAIKRTIIECCAGDVFTAGLEEMDAALHQDLTRRFGHDLRFHFAEHLGRPISYKIFERFRSGGDRTRYGLMNAITSVARDTRDPRLRWILEQAGAEIGSGRMVTLGRMLRSAKADVIPVETS
jgi:hypothetical protein